MVYHITTVNCNDGTTENQEHLEVCYRFERRGLNMDMDGQSMGKADFQEKMWEETHCCG